MSNNNNASAARMTLFTLGLLGCCARPGYRERCADHGGRGV